MGFEAALLLAFFAVAMLLAAVFDTAIKRAEARRRLRRLEHFDTVDPRAVRERELAAPTVERIVFPAMRRVSQMARRFTPASVVDRLDEELVLGGVSGTWDGERVLAVKLVATIGMAILLAFLAPAAGMDAVQTLVIVGLFGFVGWYAPEWILRSRSSERQESIRRALPDALDLLSISVNAGLGFDSALDRVSREMRGPLGEEFYRVVQEMRLGKGRAEALRSLGDRTNVGEMDSFILAMIQAETFGVSISGVLEAQSRELRVRRRQRAEEAAQKIPVKILLPLILCIFPALMIVIVGPAAITIYENFINAG